MADTDWSQYDTCPTCLAEAGKPCQSMKGSGQLMRTHVGRQKATSGMESLSALLPPLGGGKKVKRSQPAATPGLTDNRYNEMEPAAKHHIKVTRQKLGAHWTWRATCSCGTLDGHFWGDDVSPKKEFERHLVPGVQ